MRLIPGRLFILLSGLLTVTPVYAQEVAGWLEYVLVSDGIGNIVMKAKLDTGAKTTSINSEQYKIFKKDGKDWVRFELTSHKGKTIVLEEPIVRYVKIKRHFTGSQSRPVIKLGLCLGNTYHQTEVNLVDRSQFNYQLLVGRRFLEKGIVVDASKKYVTSPECKAR